MYDIESVDYSCNFDDNEKIMKYIQFKNKKALKLLYIGHNLS